MAAVCEICDKSPGFGKRNARLGKGALKRRIKAKTSRRFNPNIQSMRVAQGGNTRKINVCTTCIKSGRVQRAAAV
ncbi:LSU ribosomal protein L28P [Pseudonocardia thermophila]|uniref:Large ribosomal subunit protein bL28 n=1 Tax=Pseudonocardia thermophila TaxID=1848 RepID=A0A1M6WS68_PSETH|nr:50S ribosomal protein L28 [Pseudonocardia thermophila]SHK96573.1 LSU ribosomal protein L28P [Pseudonocardia thermophila]